MYSLRQRRSNLRLAKYTLSTPAKMEIHHGVHLVSGQHKWVKGQFLHDVAEYKNSLEQYLESVHFESNRNLAFLFSQLPMLTEEDKEAMAVLVDGAKVLEAQLQKDLKNLTLSQARITKLFQNLESKFGYITGRS